MQPALAEERQKAVRVQVQRLAEVVLGGKSEVRVVESEGDFVGHQFARQQPVAVIGQKAGRRLDRARARREVATLVQR